MLEGILGVENWFLIALGLIWIIGAVLQDLKRREVDNLWNFSLVTFALAYRFIVSLDTGNFWFIFNGLVAWGIFVILGNLFYYSRLFAGGDAKLVMSLGPILALSYNWIVNFKIFGLFIILFMITGSLYAMIWSLFLVVGNRKRFREEFRKQVQVNKKIIIIAIVFSLIWFIVAFVISEIELGLIGLVILLFPFLFVFAKSVEESCMVRKVNWNRATVGDWLYEDIVINGNKIKASWDGISEKELKQIKKNKKEVWIKYGIPFTPAFLFAFIGLMIIFWRYTWILG
jgi:hypothetical protein